MAKCPSCQADDVYNSGFSVECVNRSCRFFSEVHRQACQGKIDPRLQLRERTRKVLVAPDTVRALLISSATAVHADLLQYTDGKDTLSYVRYLWDTTHPDGLVWHLTGNQFSIEFSVDPDNVDQKIHVELLGDSRETMYTTSVSFSEQDRKFEISSME